MFDSDRFQFAILKDSSNFGAPGGAKRPNAHQNAHLKRCSAVKSNPKAKGRLAMLNSVFDLLNLVMMPAKILPNSQQCQLPDCWLAQVADAQTEQPQRS